MQSELKLKTQTDLEAYTLHYYDHRFDAGLAAMWNESDDQWPGTFTDGVPFTAERIAEWMDRIEAIIKFIVVENATGKVVGYGDLWDTAVRPGSCYVSLLNVHPAHQKHSLARRMLTRMVDWAVENGYDRLTIGTWPANLKAMPLYKKVGFFWTPDTTVHMENYVPAVRLLPAAQPYFARHDWYRTYARELQQVEDDMRHPKTGGMKIYLLRWEADEDYLEAIFDRNGQTLTGISTPRWEAYARTSEPEPAQGVSHPFEWEVTNKGSAPLPAALRVTADKGIEIDQQATFVLQPGASRILRSAFRVAPDAPAYRGDHEEIPTPRIYTALQLGGETLELGTGLRYQPAVEVSLHPPVAQLTPGVPQEVHVQIRSHAKTALTGQVTLALPDGLSAGWTSREFTAPPAGYAGLPLELTADAGFHTLDITASFDDAGRQVDTPAKTFAVSAFEPGGMAAGIAGDEVVIENDYFRLIAKAQGGEAEIWNKVTQDKEAILMEELGLPFVPWDLHEQKYELDLHEQDGVATAIMTVGSTRFPGVRVGREIAANASPLIRVRHWVANHGGEPRTGILLRPHMQVWRQNNTHVTLPLAERIIREHAAQFLITEEDLPRQPERYAAEWLAYERSTGVLGMLWARPDLKELYGESGRHFFVYTLPDLAPGATQHAAPFYLYAGPGSWHTVQQAWERITRAARLRRPNQPPAAAGTHFHFAFAAEPLTTLGDDLTVELTAHTTRELKLTGDVEIAPPGGWEAHPQRVTFTQLDHTAPGKAEVVLRAAAPAGVGASRGELRFTCDGFDQTRPFTLLKLGDAAQTVETGHFKLHGQAVWSLANGRMVWQVAPQFHGGLIGWRDAGQETNHLLTSFPDEGEFSFMKPWLGGIRPALSDPHDPESWPGKLHQERFTVTPAAAPDARGAWAGLRLAAQPGSERFRGLRVELDYLTLPGSNVLKAVYRVFNETAVYRHVNAALMAFWQVGGAPGNAIAHTQGISRKRTALTAWTLDGPWAAVENPETGQAVAVVMSGGWQQVQAVDWGTLGVHTFAYDVWQVPPGGMADMTVFYALCAAGEARLYRALA